MTAEGVTIKVNVDVEELTRFVRDVLIPDIREAIDKEDVVLFSAHSRQAQILEKRCSCEHCNP